MTDERLFRAFEACMLPKEALHHREHLRLAYAYLARWPDLAEAALRFRRALKRYAAAQGLEGVYHDTITWAYLALVHERMQASGSEGGSLGLLARHPDLLDHRGGALSRYYDVDALTASSRARRMFVLPGDEGHGEREG
jgi:hypothetical protein